MEIGKVIGRGAQSVVYESEGYAIKIYRPGYDKAAIFFEAAVTSLIEQTGLAIPRVYEVVRIDDRFAVKMDYIKGISLNDCMKQDMEHVGHYIETLVDLQLAVQSKAIKLPFHLCDILKGRIEHTHSFDDSTKRRLLQRLAELPRGDQLCHGDFHGYNVIKWDDGNFIID
ncbi:MAG: phosphotransferase [Clostridia bacterium]|nr:phosphotransferase [Clostridia bacterium]MDR3643583.1 phosphotransferase [Clostridia bacterium]